MRKSRRFSFLSIEFESDTNIIVTNSYSYGHGHLRWGLHKKQALLKFYDLTELILNASLDQ